MFESRRQDLIQAVKKKELAAVLIDSPSNLYYYSGFTGGEAMLFLPVGQDKGYMITDSRYYEQVELECPELTLIRLETKRYSEVLKELTEQLQQDGILVDTIKIGIEASMQVDRYLKLSEACENCSFVPAGDTVGERRMVKDEEEIARLEQAEAIGDAAFTHILPYIKPGITEAELALELEFFMKRQGASKLSFDTIVASGPNSSMPHAQVTNRKIEKGDFVTMDFGCVYQGYCSDMTRTVAVGNPTEEMRKVYQIVLDANLRAMEGIREGVSCQEVDALARDYIRNQGYGDYFGHGLGHGVGLDIHEEPRFSPKCKVVTKENMVITDEPGIYLPGRFGVRIEDLVVVTKTGCRALSHSDKQLIVL